MGTTRSIAARGSTPCIVHVYCHFCNGKLSISHVVYARQYTDPKSASSLSTLKSAAGTSFVLVSLVMLVGSIYYFSHGATIQDTPCDPGSANSTCCGPGYACFSNNVCALTEQVSSEIAKISPQYIPSSYADPTWSSRVSIVLHERVQEEQPWRSWDESGKLTVTRVEIDIIAAIVKLQTSVTPYLAKFDVLFSHRRYVFGIE